MKLQHDIPKEVTRRAPPPIPVSKYCGLPWSGTHGNQKWDVKRGDVEAHLYSLAPYPNDINPKYGVTAW